MSVTPERLAAYADGELDPVEARAVEAEIESNPGLQAQLAAHRALRARLAAHFAPIAEQPVPERLRQTLAGEVKRDEVVDFAAAAHKKRGASLPRWTWIAGPALAASLVLAIFGFGTRASHEYAEGELDHALDTQLVASQPRDARLRILLSFENAEGQFCRGFSGASRAGIACRDDRGWRLHKLIGGASSQTSEYRQAGSADAEVLAAVQEMAAGPALDAAGELRAARQGWRPSPADQ